MKNKKEFILIEGTIFPFDILFTTAEPEKIYKYIETKKKYPLSDKEKEVLVMTKKGKAVQLANHAIVIILPKVKTSLGIDMADLAHEIVHAVFFISETIDIKHSNDSDEFFAYYQAYLTREILKKLQE